MLIEYYASDSEDDRITKALENFHIEHWFNPEDEYYVIETNDDRIVKLFALLGIEWYEVVSTKKSWHEYAFDDETAE